MIQGLEQVLESSGLPGLAEVRQALERLLGGSKVSGRLVEQQILQPRGQRVFRLRFTIEEQNRSVVIKRLKPEIARRNELVAHRWLPAIGLNEAGPPLLGSVAAQSGECVWHIYDDLGSWELDPREPDRAKVEAAIALICQLHLGFARHALLGEIRLYGGDLGMNFCQTNVRDALNGLQAWHPQPEQRGVRDRLLARLRKLEEELPQRIESMSELSGPETLLHGDLWAINVFVMPTAQASSWTARLIDWDHAAVGPITYDLSTFLLRFPAIHREWAFELYRERMLKSGWKLPSPEQLNLLFETHEYARFANRIIWPAIALTVDGAEWGTAELAEIEKWFEQFQPVLPVGSKPTSARPAEALLSHQMASACR